MSNKSLGLYYTQFPAKSFWLILVITTQLLPLASCQFQRNIATSFLAIPTMAPVASPTSVLQVTESSKATMSPDKSSNPTHATNTTNRTEHLTNPRSCILQVGVSAGRLCGVANSHLMDPSTIGNSSKVLVWAISDLLQDLFRTAKSLDLNIHQSIRAKLELNNKKYPVDLCKGKAGKYTQYSHLTGITETNQSTQSSETTLEYSWKDFCHDVPTLAEEIKVFAEAREWSKFHKPRNLILALLGEVGELAELLQWKGDDDVLRGDSSEENTSLDAETKDKLSQEIADVTIYLLRLTTVCEVVSPLTEALVETDLA